MSAWIANLVPVADTWGMHGDVGTGWWILMMLGMVAFWGAVVLGVIWLARGGLRADGGSRAETALETLDRRLADGSISREEYAERRKILTDSQS